MNILADYTRTRNAFRLTAIEPSFDLDPDGEIDKSILEKSLDPTEKNQRSTMPLLRTAHNAAGGLTPILPGLPVRRIFIS